MSEDTTNPVDVEDDAVLDQPEVEVEADDTADIDTDETEGQADEAPPEDDTEEIERDGVKYRIPKALKDDLLRQADYTRKTQEVAETRRALAERAQALSQQAQLAEATLEDRANLKLIEQTLAQYSGWTRDDWAAYEAHHGPGSASVASAMLTQHAEARTQFKEAISRAESEIQAISERNAANAVAQAEAELSREIEGWGLEYLNSLAAYASKEFGVSPQELRESVINPDGTPDTRTIKVLARLHKAETELATLKAEKTKAQQASKQASVTPAKAVGQRAGGYKPGLNDDIPIEEYMRRRNAQIAKANGR